jgi:hypothetical protein
MKNLIILLILISISSILFSQTPPDTLWTKTFGGIYSDRGYSVQQTTDGGFIVAGETYSFGVGGDAWLIKTDENGNEEWNKTFGGDDCEYARSVQQTADGGFIITGLTASYGVGGFDVFLVKTDEFGNEEWFKTFGGNDNDVTSSGHQTFDGGFIITGDTYSWGAGNSDVFLIKTDENGNEVWHKTFGGSDCDGSRCVQQTSEGGFIISGFTESYGAGQIDAWLIKTDENGNEEWNQTFGGSNNDFANAVQETSDGGFIFTGNTYSNIENESEAWLIKVDENGNEEWNKIFSDIYSMWGCSVQQTSDSGFIIAGLKEYTYSYYNVWLVKTDVNGNEEWNKIIPIGDSVHIESIQQILDGGYIITGDIYFLSNYIVNLLLIRMNPEEVGVINDNMYIVSNALFQNFPNPFNPKTTISFSIPKHNRVKISVYNIKGEKIKTLANKEFESGIQKIIWNGKDENDKSVSSGIYFYKMETDNFSLIKKCILSK